MHGESRSDDVEAAAADAAGSEAAAEAAGADDAGARGGAAAEAAVAEGGSDDGYEAPVGTLFLLMVYVMVLAGMWVTMYWMMVGR